MAVEEARAGTERSFRVCGCLLTTLMAFKYLGRILTASDNDWSEVVGNLWKAWKKWGRISRILGRERVDAQISGTFFKSVICAVLIFGSETWVLTPPHAPYSGRFSAHFGISSDRETTV